LEKFKEIDEIISRLTMQDETLHVRLEENYAKLDTVEKTIEGKIRDSEKRLEESLSEKLGQRERNCKISMSMIDSEIKSFKNQMYELTQGFKTVGDVVRGVNDRTTTNETQIDHLERETEEIRRKINEFSEYRQSDHAENTFPIIQQRIKHTPPTFNGSTRPMQFLSELQQYWRATNPNEAEFEYVINACLKESVKDWWYLVRSEVNNFETFKSKFVERYWNENVQYKIKERLEFGYYNPNKGKSRVNYTINLFSNAKDLIPPPTDKEVILKLSRHFNEDLRTAILARGINNLSVLLELLEAFDQAGQINRNKYGREDHPRVNWRNQESQERSEGNRREMRNSFDTNRYYQRETRETYNSNPQQLVKSNDRPRNNNNNYGNNGRSHDPDKRYSHDNQKGSWQHPVPNPGRERDIRKVHELGLHSSAMAREEEERPDSGNELLTCQ
jgi:hypothetical protein